MPRTLGRFAKAVDGEGQRKISKGLFSGGFQSVRNRTIYPDRKLSRHTSRRKKKPNKKGRKGGMGEIMKEIRK